MSYNVKNRIPQLKAALTRINNPAYREEQIHPLAERFAERMLTTLKKNAPAGRVEPDYQVGKLHPRTISHGRASLRQHGTTLASSWNQPEVLNRFGVAKISISSKAPHMPLLLSGAIGHTIPFDTETPVSFFWFKRGYPVIKQEVHHPGFRSRQDFVARSVLENRAEGTRVVNYGQRASLTPLRVYFS